MPFSTDIAALVSNQLARFVTLNPHQLAGQAANLDFWLGQVRHCLSVIDGYAGRFRQMKAAQAQHVALHQTIEFSMSDPCCTAASPRPPRKIADNELSSARRELCENARRFLVRCHHEGHLDAAGFQQACETAGIGFDPIESQT